MPPKVPVEYADAKKTAEQAWREYDGLLEAGASRAEIEAALQRAYQADAARHHWYDLWQKVGGTSDVASVVEALLEDEKDRGTRFIISGGDVLEIDAPPIRNVNDEIPFPF